MRPAARWRVLGMVAAVALTAGCSAVLGITDLPPATGVDGGASDASTDTSVPRLDAHGDTSPPADGGVDATSGEVGVEADTGVDTGADSGADAAVDAPPSDDAGLACGPTLVCDDATDFCEVTTGGVVLPDGAVNMTYACDAIQASCQPNVTCSCITQGTPGCSCSETNGAFTVTCFAP